MMEELRVTRSVQSCQIMGSYSRFHHRREWKYSMIIIMEKKFCHMSDKTFQRIVMHIVICRVKF